MYWTHAAQLSNAAVSAHKLVLFTRHAGYPGLTCKHVLYSEAVCKRYAVSIDLLSCPIVGLAWSGFACRVYACVLRYGVALTRLALSCTC